MTVIDYTPKGVCARGIHIELEGKIIRHISFTGGCPGNTQGVARLAEGRDADEVISCIKGILCRGKDTSCPDQLALALEQAKAEGKI